MQVLVIGANGNIGFRVAHRLTTSSHEPVAMIRHSGQRARFDALDIPTVLVDHLGAIRAAVAAFQQGAARFIMLSALNAAPDANTRITHYHRAKGRADQFLREMADVMDGRSLDWTTVHPGERVADALRSPGPHTINMSQGHRSAWPDVLVWATR